MGKVGIHFENKLVVFADRPFEPMNIGRAKPQFALTLLEEKLTGIFQLKPPDNPGRAVWRTVIDHQDMIPLPQLKYGLEDNGNIFLFVIRRYDDDLFQMAYICVGYTPPSDLYYV